MIKQSLELKSIWQSALSSRSLSVRGLARETGMSHTYLAQIMSGKCLPSDAIRSRLLARLDGLRSEDLFLPPQPSREVGPAVTCKRCHSANTIKSGCFRGNQRYQCKECGSVFIANGAPLYGSLPLEAVVAAMEHFLAAESLDSICSLIEDVWDIPLTVVGLEKLVYRYCRKAVRLAADIIPPLSSRWMLESFEMPGGKFAVLDVLDLESGFIISSDIIRPNELGQEKESPASKTYRLAGFRPRTTLVGPRLLLQMSGSAAPNPEFSQKDKAVYRRYYQASLARNSIISRRSNLDSFAGTVLICQAWRVHHNFLNDSGIGGPSRYNCWLDVINASDLVVLPRSNDSSSGSGKPSQILVGR